MSDNTDTEDTAPPVSASAPTQDSIPALAQAVVSELVRRGITVAAAESLTGGLVTATLTSVPGSSTVVRGGVVAYATDVKASILGVDVSRLTTVGPVDREVARQMAAGAARVLGARIGVATTGEAGPESASGAPVGTVHVAVVGPGGERTSHLMLPGNREEICRGAVRAVLELLAASLADDPCNPG